MPSPFPGMDPYLEGHLWTDFHCSLSVCIRLQLTQVLPRHYVALINNTIPRDLIPKTGPSIDVRSRPDDTLVASIEVLSPHFKGEPGHTAYGKYRQKVIDSGVHLLEMDLLRRGSHPSALASLHDTPYLVALTRTGSGYTEVWPIGLRNRLPVVSLALRGQDNDVPIDLQAALNEVYDDAAYELSINYHMPPPPPVLSEQDLTWIGSLSS